MDLAAKREIFPSAPEIAYYRLFSEVLERTAALAARFDEVVKLTFDISTENEFNAALVYAMFREDNPQMFAHLAAEISFVPAKENPRVQVSDLMAYEAMKAIDHEVGPIKRTRGSWEAMRNTGRFETIRIGLLI